MSAIQKILSSTLNEINLQLLWRDILPIYIFLNTCIWASGWIVLFLVSCTVAVNSEWLQALVGKTLVYVKSKKLPTGNWHLLHKPFNVFWVLSIMIQRRNFNVEIKSILKNFIFYASFKLHTAYESLTQCFEEEWRRTFWMI